MSKVLCMVPARLDSKRLPGKLLLEVNDRPLICQTVERILQADEIGRVCVCTNSAEIADIVFEWFEKEDRVDVKCNRYFVDTGTDRTSLTLMFNPELLDGMSRGCVLHIHGDEVNVNPKAIDALVRRHINKEYFAPMTQLLMRTHTRDVSNPNSCKAHVEWGGEITGYSRDRDSFYTATGVFAYDPVALMSYHKFHMGPKEMATNIEQYRLLEMGLSIQGYDACLGESKSAVDSQEDYDRLVKYYEVPVAE